VKFGVVVASMTICLACGSSGRTGGGSPPVASGQPAPGGVITIDPGSVVIDAAFTGLRDSLRLVLPDQATWGRMWRDIQRNTTPVPPTPQIDFATYRLLVAALGPKPTTGYHIAIDSVVTAGNATVVFVSRSRPGDGCITGQSFTSPVQVVRVSGDLGRVTWKESERVVGCE